MSNKISGTDSRPVLIAPGSAVSRAPGGNLPGKSENKPAAPGGDVHITGAAQHLAALEQSIRELPAIDASRVSAVRHRLDTGSYQPDPQRVADGFIYMNAVLGLDS